MSKKTIWVWKSTNFITQPFRYTSREYDEDTGLYHYRARAYDPTTGRFLQEYPIGFNAGDLNVYRYVWNNPANWTDPSGMNRERAALAGISVGLLRGLQVQPYLFSLARYHLNRKGLKYFLAIAARNLQRIQAVEGTLGDTIALNFAAIAGTIHQANIAGDPPRDLVLKIRHLRKNMKMMRPTKIIVRILKSLRQIILAIHKLKLH